MPIHVAIADDHSAVRLGMKYLVEEWMPESTVHFAQDLPTLLRLLTTQPIDLIVLDINIPGGNNFQMVSMIRNRSEEHTSELQSRENLVCRLLLEKKKDNNIR